MYLITRFFNEGFDALCENLNALKNIAMEDTKIQNMVKNNGNISNTMELKLACQNIKTLILFNITPCPQGEKLASLIEAALLSMGRIVPNH